MSKLYLTGRTDARKTALTSRAHKWIDLTLGYDKDDYNKVIKVRLNLPDFGEYKDKVVLWVNGNPAFVTDSPYKK